jgi:hypothetical protein
MLNALFLYYSYTKQALRVADVMAGTFRPWGFDVQQATIEFTDPRYADRFSRIPLRHPYIDLFRMLPARLRRGGGATLHRRVGRSTGAARSNWWWPNPVG